MTSDAHHGHPSTTPGCPSSPGGVTGIIDPAGRDPLPLAGRTVLVTGVSRRIGIGHAIACRAADYGASIVAHHYRPHDASQPWGADDIDAVMDSIRTHLVGPARLVDIPADLASPGEPARVVEQAAAAAGHLDALVCNQAMSSPDGSLSEMTEAVLDAHWAVDARASILLAQAFAAQEGFAASAPAGSVRRRGAIVFLTSGQGLGPLPGEIAYAAAKAAIAGLTPTISEELIDAVMDSIRTHLVGPARLIDIPADLAAPGEPARVVEQAAAAVGHLDSLVCNQAMSSPDGSLSEMTEAVLDAHWAVDARASILLAQAFAAQEGFAASAPAGSVRRRGAIVFLTSGQGLGPLPGEIAYAAAKAAIAGLTPTISEELIDAGITVNTVNPGPVDTGYVTEADREATAAMFPQGRWGEPDDAARLITWLLTDEARWITGQVINSEGGFARWRR